MNEVLSLISLDTIKTNSRILYWLYLLLLRLTLHHLRTLGLNKPTSWVT